LRRLILFYSHACSAATWPNSLIAEQIAEAAADCADD
jgi:hypothetical protein